MTSSRKATFVPGNRYGERFMSIRNEQYRYIRYNDNQEEIYNCIPDPHEWINQISNPEYAPSIDHLRVLLPALPEMAPAVPSKKRK